MVFLGERFSAWQHPSELLPFKRHAHEKELCASELVQACKLPRPQVFQKGLKARTDCHQRMI